jgi:hypothetical protein
MAKTGVPVRANGGVPVRANGSVPLVEPGMGDCGCCGCHCFESEGLASPPTWRMRVGPLTVRTLTLEPVVDPDTSDTFAVSVSGTFAAVDVCLAKQASGPGEDVIYTGTLQSPIAVAFWLNGTGEGIPNGTGAKCLLFTLNATTGRVIVSLPFVGSSYPGSPAGDDYIIASGTIDVGDLPAGWCVDGLTVPAEPFTFVDDGLRTDQGFPALTDGAGTFLLTPCCTPGEPCVEGCVECPPGLPSDYVLTGDQDGVPFISFIGNSQTGGCLWEGGTTVSTMLGRGVSPCGFGLTLFDYPTAFKAGDDPSGPWPDITGGGHAYTNLLVS